MPKDFTPDERAKIQVALETLQRTQEEFWDALHEMERLLGADLEDWDNRDFSSYNVDNLIEAAEEMEG